MDEELSDNDLEERLYAMLHHVDETQNNLNGKQQEKSQDVLVENAPKSTMRRYWRVGSEYKPNPYIKVNTPNQPTPVVKPLQPTPAVKQHNITTKEVTTSQRPLTPVDLSILQSPVPPKISLKTIEYIDHEPVAVVLESSDEDEVVEVALPPKPTITIDSSDEDIVNVESPTKTNSKSNLEAKNVDSAGTASPVPSVVSSVSDEFIRGDCIALNISSRKPDKHSFDFSLHGSDLLVQNTPSKKKKRKKNKEVTTSTPNVVPASNPNTDVCFATPKSKAKNKKQKGKLFTEKTIPTPDIYDSDSNQSVDNTNNPYIVTNYSVPNVDVYESDSNQSEIQKEHTDQRKNRETQSSDSSTSQEASNTRNTLTTTIDSVDLTGNDFITLDATGINESIVMGNVTGLDNTYDSSYENYDISRFVSSRVPSILNEDLDFDHLKGKDKVCKKRYSPTTLRSDMDKFYNESWGGENFNHKEILKHMSRDKSLWAIDPKDRMPPNNRKMRCNYCNRVGHRDDTCRQKPPVCFMCGCMGHYEPRCPNKICLNCGAPNFMYSTMCRSCSAWRNMRCNDCSHSGHPASHCPSLWRRYHDTTNNTPILETSQLKKPYQQYCSGCTRRGHLVHECRVTIPFSGLPIYTPLVTNYQPTFNVRNRSKSFTQDTQNKNKRLSKSPITQETPNKKKRNLSLDERANSPLQKTKEVKNKTIDSTPVVPEPQKKEAKKIDSTETTKNKNKANENTVVEKAPNFIPITSNRDNDGHLIQDNEVSDTSDVITSARIYVTNDIINKIKTKEGDDWLKANMKNLNVNVTHSDINSFLTIRGKVADQETFQTELRNWSNDSSKPKSDEAPPAEDAVKGLKCNLPKNRYNLLRQLNKALDSLKEDLGDPRKVYKELVYSQNKHKQLLKQKVVNPKMLKRNRSHIKDMLKKLNKILLGQAGLADGTTHVNALRSVREQLLTSRQKNISPTLRKGIAGHYDSVFTSMERKDYLNLVNMFYSTRAEQFATNTINKSTRKKNQLKKLLGNMNATNNQSIPAQENKANNMPAPNNGLNPGKTNHLQKLKFYHQRLQRAIPKNRAAKHEAFAIMRRVHAFIQSLNNKEHVPSKTAKKVMKVQKDAQQFLSEKIK